jgi:hypothetical protein
MVVAFCPSLSDFPGKLPLLAWLYFPKFGGGLKTARCRRSVGLKNFLSLKEFSAFRLQNGPQPLS